MCMRSSSGDSAQKASEEIVYNMRAESMAGS